MGTTAASSRRAAVSRCRPVRAHQRARRAAWLVSGSWWREVATKQASGVAAAVRAAGGWAPRPPGWRVCCPRRRGRGALVQRAWPAGRMSSGGRFAGLAGARRGLCGRVGRVLPVSPFLSWVRVPGD